MGQSGERGEGSGITNSERPSTQQPRIKRLYVPSLGHVQGMQQRTEHLFSLLSWCSPTSREVGDQITL